MKATEAPPIDVEATTDRPDPPAANTQALARVEQGGAVGRAMTIDELHKNLEFIRAVMKKEMREGTDYGKIPGTGDKPSLLQPGAQKLLMTFNLTEKVKKEIKTDYPGFHREYEFTITVCAGNGKEWDGVGTCSTLESKYRYRKAERKCPNCGKTTIIQGKEEFGGGFICWKKKGGCSSKFAENDERITSQPADVIENEDPADCWNTVRKMAFKRGLVAASINATNTSELWTQDVEDMAGNAETQKERARQKQAQNRSEGPPPAQRGAPPRQTQPQTAKPTPQAQNKAPGATEPKYATAKTREWMIEAIKDYDNLALEYFRALEDPCVLLPNEGLKDIPLRFVPVSHAQLSALRAAIHDFSNGDRAAHAFAPNPLAPEPEKKAPAKPKQPKPAAAPPPAAKQEKARDPEWWRDVICPIPPRGMKRADYLGHEITVGQMYDERHSEEGAKRLFGYINHYEFKTTWTNQDGKEVPRGADQLRADELFREALDACGEYHEKHRNDSPPTEPAAPEREPGGFEEEPEDDIPM